MNTVPRIVVGVDGFESSKAALRWAIHQAKLTGAARSVSTACATRPAPSSSCAASQPRTTRDPQ
jgi:nucleotide-binding universal stress UspA family protein